MGEKATAVAASTVLMTFTEVHFPSRFFQILTYCFIRLRAFIGASDNTYRLIARSRSEDVAFAGPSTIPDNPRVRLVRSHEGVFGVWGITGMRSEFPHLR